MKLNYHCPFCLSRNTFRIEISKKGKPFLSCQSCSLKVFFTNPFRIQVGLYLMLNLLEYLDKIGALDDIQKAIEGMNLNFFNFYGAPLSDIEVEKVSKPLPTKGGSDE